jgi:hypothetical protein
MAASWSTWPLLEGSCPSRSASRALLRSWSGRETRFALTDVGARSSQARPVRPALEADVLLLLAASLVTAGELQEAAWTAARAADLRRDDPSVVFHAASCVRRFSVSAAHDYIDHVHRLLAERDDDGGFPFRAELLALEGPGDAAGRTTAADRGARGGRTALPARGAELGPGTRGWQTVGRAATATP